MRGGILAVGIILLILGIFLYFTGNNMVEEVEAYDIEGIPISEILKLVSEDARRQYEMGQSMVTFGTIFGIVGFIVCIAGIAAPSKKPQIISHQPSQPPVIVQQSSPREVAKSDRRCPGCGRVIPEDVKMCPYCGKKFKSHFDKEKEEESKEEEEKNKDLSKKKTKTPKHCPECGFKLEEENLNFCPSCGSKFE